MQKSEPWKEQEWMGTGARVDFLSGGRMTYLHRELSHSCSTPLNTWDMYILSHLSFILKIHKAQYWCCWHSDQSKHWYLSKWGPFLSTTQMQTECLGLWQAVKLKSLFYLLTKTFFFISCLCHEFSKDLVSSCLLLWSFYSTVAAVAQQRESLASIFSSLG